MTAVGNVLLFFCTLVFALLLSIMYGKQPAGDGLIGYGFSVIVLNVALFTGLAIISLIVGSRKGFAWIADKGALQFIIVGGALIFSVITVAFSGLLRYENARIPALFRMIMVIAPVIIPLVWIITSAILLNGGLRSIVNESWYRWPFAISALIGTLGTISVGVMRVANEQRNQAARIKDQIEFEDRNEKRKLDDIDSCDVSKNLVFLLVFTDSNQAPHIRARALAKIRTNPRWQEELLAKLQNDWAPEVFTYLASNDPDDPALFAEPVRHGILIQAKLIRETIRKAYSTHHLYDSQFSWEIERVLRTAEKWERGGRGYLPEIKQIRAAFDQTAEVEKPSFLCIPYLDEWIRRHS